MAGLMLWEAKLKYGRERAAANVLDVVAEEADDGVVAMVGDPGIAVVPTCPKTFCEALLGAFCRRS